VTEGGAIAVHGPRDRSRFALTFDDGPGGGTRAALERLARASAKATFFMVGEQVKQQPELARAVFEAGHEVGSHSMRHLDHQHAERELVVTDVLEGAAAIEDVLGFEPRLYRPPYGHFAPGSLDVAERRGWTCVFWSASGEDWREGESDESIVARILADLLPGAIVLLHDARRAKPTDCAPMLGALERILAEAKRRGLVPATVGELLALS
jgi:peptidoglycan/xylan/chitin deacetylase (PgdA/CDA1 family)